MDELISAFQSDWVEAYFTYRAGVVILAVGVFVVVGRLRPLRQQSPFGRPEGLRWLRNGMLAGVTEAAQRLFSAPVVALVLPLLLGLHPGLFASTDLPWILRAGGSLLVLDALLYGWHRLNHTVPGLWRFHRVHHADPQMDATTGVRFHPGEYVLAAGVGILQLWVVGADLQIYILYDGLVTFAVPFHHANFSLGHKVDRALQAVIVTPEFHGIHHSQRPEETHSNYGTVFTFWDRLFGSYRARTPAAEIDIGLDRPLPERFFALLASPWKG